MTYSRIIAAGLNARGLRSEAQTANPYWGGDLFGLNKISAFNESSEENKRDILLDISQSFLEEALQVEKRGFDFASKMILIEDSEEVKQAYGLILTDEVEHYFELKRFLHKKESDENAKPFIRLLKDIVSTSDSYLMVFFLQVVLEGWGMTYYRDLLCYCRDDDLKALWKRILQDEARHHATGLTHYKLHQGHKRDVDAMMELLTTFLSMVQLGPQTCVGTLARHHGSLTKKQLITAFEECEGVLSAQKTLEGVKRLLSHDLDGTLLYGLEARGLFRAHSAQECAKVCLSLD